MTFNESQRIQLHQALGRQIGEEMAGVLMSSLPPFDWNQIATKEDLKVFATRDEMNVKFAELRVELHKSLRSNTLTMVGLNFAIGSLLLGVAQFIGR